MNISNVESTYSSRAVSKIAAVTATFWLLKILATTLGETAGDFLAQTLDLGYVAGLAITGTILPVLLVAQIRAKHYHPVLFWAAIIGTTTAGTEISDMMDRAFNLGYAAGSMVLLLGLVVALAVWYRREGTLSIDHIRHRQAEAMFWIAVLFSNSLGTAYGDFLVDNLELGYLAAAAVCTAVIGFVIVLYYKRAMNDVALFWIAFVFTCPFGATFGDLLTKPLAKGGFDLGTQNASLVCFLLMAVLIGLTMRANRQLQPELVRE